MTFNSTAYLLFLPVVFALYWLLQRYPLRWQNALVLAASYLFYGWWDWRFLGLLLFSTTTDYAIGRWLDNTTGERRRRHILFISLFVNLGLLGFFKYFNFFSDTLIECADRIGWQLHPFTLRIILPVGISFYTFQSLSYTIDVYRRRMPATRDALAFAAFVSFFPQLVAGPIERAGHLLPQFLQKRRFDSARAVAGCRLMLWGFLKKVVLADNLAPLVERIFDHPAGQNAWTVALGAACFALQIYGDFSGYSDIAVGSARLFGFDLMQNFRTPYFAASFRTFWQRWHISLSTWFRDYVYVPLGGNRRGKFRQAFNLLITFVLSGLWHGANWTFIVWGFWHGSLVALESLSGFREPGGRPQRAVSNSLVFALVCIGWVFFRAKSLEAACTLLGHLGKWDGGLTPFSGVFPSAAKVVALAVVLTIFLLLERRSEDRGIDALLAPLTRPLRWAVYYIMLGVILLLGVFDNAPVFIYFQF